MDTLVLPRFSCPGLCPGCPATVFLYRLSCPSYLVKAVMFRTSCPLFLGLVVFSDYSSLLSCPGCCVRAVPSTFFPFLLHPCPVLVMFVPSNPLCPAWASCPWCPSGLSWPICLVLNPLSRMSNPDCSSQAFLCWLSCSTCSGLAVLGCQYVAVLSVS